VVLSAGRSATSLKPALLGFSHEMEEEPRFGPYHRAHLLLRGRYRYLLPIMCIFGLAAAAYGYRSRQVIYYSEGLLHIALRLPEVINQTCILNICRVK
jgi:hypothetical protein